MATPVTPQSQSAAPSNPGAPKKIVPQPLPESVRPKDTPESVRAAPLGKITYGKVERDLYIEPLWTEKVSKAHRKKADSRFKNWAFDRRFVDTNENVAVVNGTFERALQVAAKRAKRSHRFWQAQAVVEGLNGRWLVGGVGNFANNRKTFEYVALDGTIEGTPVDQVLGEFVSVTRNNPNFSALVGATDWLDLREAPVVETEEEHPAEEPARETADDREKKPDPWAVQETRAS